MSQGAADFTPLSGLRVLDLSRYLPGPYLTRMLDDLGAEVVKVESPSGDPARYTPPQAGGASALFQAVNAGKRSIVIDLKQPSGVTLVRALAAKSDIVVESFRPGVATRLGIDYAALSEENPGLIMCSISGYGQAGPLSTVPGHDLNYVARAGVLGLFGPADGAPAVPGVQMADVGGGALCAAAGVLAALLERAQTGKGRFLDVSMTRSVMSLAATSTPLVGTGVNVPRGEGFLSGGVPCYRVYETRDQRFLALGALEPKFFTLFCELLGAPHLAKEVYATGAAGEAAAREIQEILRTRTQAEWGEVFAGQDVCCEPVRSMEEAVRDPELGLVTTRLNGCEVVLPHLGVDPNTEGLTPAPALGANGGEILREWEIPEGLVGSALSEEAVWLEEVSP